VVTGAAEEVDRAAPDSHDFAILTTDDDFRRFAKVLPITLHQAGG
jgi:hypothetical protein